MLTLTLLNPSISRYDLTPGWNPDPFQVPRERELGEVPLELKRLGGTGETEVL